MTPDQRKNHEEKAKRMAVQLAYMLQNPHSLTDEAVKAITERLLEALAMMRAALPKRDFSPTAS